MNRFGPLIVIAGAMLALAGCGGGTPGMSTSGPGTAGADPAAIASGTVDKLVANQSAVDSTAAGQTVGQPVTTTALSDPAYTVTAQGVGEVTGTPDTLIAVIGVQTSAAKAKTALDDNNRKAAAVIAALKGKGVAAKDLQTNGLSLQPRYGTKENQITGYDAFENVTATLRDLHSAGGIIDAAVTSAGDSARVQQLSFAIGDDTALRATARSNAVTQAHTQAAQMAKAAGAALGRVRSITEVPQQPQGMSAGYATPSSSGGDAAGSSVPLEPGTQQLSVVVTVSYDLA
ncbi:MAG: putative lipoprotein [Frankiales bacterium]|nr:putative lipoprotein [Frankiales bacterium]